MSVGSAPTSCSTCPVWVASHCRPTDEQMGGTGTWRVGVSRGGKSLSCLRVLWAQLQSLGCVRRALWTTILAETSVEFTLEIVFFFLNPDGAPKILHIFSGLCQTPCFKAYIAPVILTLLQNPPGDQGRWPSLLPGSGLEKRGRTGSCLDSHHFCQCAG